MERLPLYQIAFRRMEMPLVEYALKVVLPAFVGGLAVSSILFFTLSGNKDLQEELSRNIKKLAIKDAADRIVDLSLELVK